jgi:hypothetical protein
MDEDRFNIELRKTLTAENAPLEHVVERTISLGDDKTG